MSPTSKVAPNPLPIIWWNSTVIVAGSPQPVRATLPKEGDDILAFCAFAEGLGAKAIRLCYHSPHLEHLTTTCPKGSRETIRKALSPRFPALADPTTAWAAHRIRTGAAGTTTLLYIEPAPRLARMRAALEERGIFLEAAFPLLALLEVSPPASQLDSSVIALLQADEAAAVYWRTPEGDRHALFFDGPTARDRATHELVTAFSIFRTAPIFAVVDMGSVSADLAALEPKPAKVFTPEEFLGHAEALSAAEVSNFLPPAGLFTADRICQAAALLLFFIAAVTCGTYLVSLRAARTSLAIQRSEAAGLEKDSAHLQANRTRIEATDAVLAAAVVARPVKLQFLEALNRARPASISIRSVVLNEATWSVAGKAHEGVGLEKGPYQSFLANFSKRGAWTINTDSEAAVLKEPDFALNGTIP